MKIRFECNFCFFLFSIVYNGEAQQFFLLYLSPLESQALNSFITTIIIYYCYFIHYLCILIISFSFSFSSFIHKNFISKSIGKLQKNIIIKRECKHEKNVCGFMWLSCCHLLCVYPTIVLLLHLQMTLFISNDLISFGFLSSSPYAPHRSSTPTNFYSIIVNLFLWSKEDFFIKRKALYMLHFNSRRISHR